MIIAKLVGGLGNQMFQYAAGLALAARLEVPFLMDLRALESAPDAGDRCDITQVFRIDSGVADSKALTTLLGWRRHAYAQRLLLRYRSPRWFGRFVPEPHFHYWTGFERLAAPCYLDGYWQSPLYFEPVANRIRTQFAFKPPLTGRNAAVARQIDASMHTVSVHVRRGDYVSNPVTARVHGALGPDYYQAAVTRMLGLLPGAVQVFVFSDDIGWSRQHLRFPVETVFVDQNRALDSHFDMHLMSLCQHHVIANSSFSWWAAWLNRNPDKRVIAPERWFGVAANTSTLIPATWIRI